MMIDQNQPDPPPVEPRPARRRGRWLLASGILLLTLVVRAPFLPTPGFIGDQTQFLMWSSLSRSGGLTAAYAYRPDGSGRYWCNYPPGYVCVLRGLAEVYRGVSGRELDASVISGFTKKDDSRATRWAALLYKMPAVAADAALGVLLFLLLANRIGPAWATLVAALYVLMPAVVHNSAIWGQIDAIPALLVVASLEAARRRNALWMTAFASLALLVKPQAAMMGPVWLAVLICWSGWSWRRWARAAGVALAIVVVAVLPFRDDLDGVWKSYAGAAAYYPFTHLNGFSAWFLANPLTEPHLGEPFAAATAADSLYHWYKSDAAPGLLGITPRTWGLLGVAGVGLLAFAGLYGRKCDERSLQWAARLLPLGFFVLPTQMHERYLFPAIALWAWSAGRSWRWFGGWLLLGVCASVNVLWVWAGPAEADWAGDCADFLHRLWLGVAPGAWCSAALCGLLLLTLVSPLIPARRPAPLSA